MFTPHWQIQVFFLFELLTHLCMISVFRNCMILLVFAVGIKDIFLAVKKTWVRDSSSGNKLLSTLILVFREKWLEISLNNVGNHKESLKSSQPKQKSLLKKKKNITDHLVRFWKVSQKRTFQPNFRILVLKISNPYTGCLQGLNTVPGKKYVTIATKKSKFCQQE